VTDEAGPARPTGPVTQIRSVHAFKIRVPFRRPFATSQGMWLEREAWIIRLLDADGRTGLGEAVLEPADGETASTVLDHLVHELAMLAPGDRLPSTPDLEIHGSPGRALRAAIDSARLDLGGSPADGLRAGGVGVGVNATIPSIGPDASASAARQSVEAGFLTLKLKGGAERETEVLVDRIRAVRSAVGPDVRLRLDVNGAWDLETATDRLEAIGRFGLEYVEQPLAGDDAAGLAELRRRVRVPIAADETVTSVRAARELLDAAAVDVLVVKLARVGGPVAAAEIALLAAERDVPVVVSTLFETGIGIAAGLAVAAALPQVGGPSGGRPPDHGLATAGVLDHDLLLDELPVDDGRMRVPGAPGSGGLGVRLDERAMARFVVETAGSG
jgi:L-alanine-DL-glutamate epimerase-like enolase superfamily enzyme